MLPKLPSTAD